MSYELRSVGIEEVDLIEHLFQEVYNREQGMDYWKWCFQNPYGYLNTGMFEKNRLIGYHAFHLTPTSGYMVSAMVHPKFRKQGIYGKITEDLIERMALLKDYVFLFSNEMIRPIHLGREGYTEVYQIKEYRVPFNKDFMKEKQGWDFFKEYEIWRYRNHPLIKYIFHCDEYGMAIFSQYEDRIQIVDFTIDVYDAINMGQYLAKAYNKDIVSFWSEVDLNLPFVMIPTWKHYKILNPLNIDMETIMKIDKTRMGMSDVF